VSINNLKLPDFADCPECGGEKSCFKYTRAKNNKAHYLCNDCNKHIEMEFGTVKPKKVIKV